MKIALSRIDERLIHGQVMTAWLGYAKANKIIIIDDELFNDDFMKQVLTLAAPSNVEVKVYSVEEMEKQYKNDSDESSVVLLFKSPLYLLKLLERDVKLSSVDLGNLGSKPTRNKICKNIYLSDDEKQILEQILEKNCNIYVRMLPNDPIKELKDFY